MTDASDRPDWLPTPPAELATAKRSRWKRAAWFAVRLPSLILIAGGIGLVMLAGAALVDSKTIGVRNHAVGTAVGLVVLAAMAFGLAALLRAAPRRWQSILRSTTIPASGAQMTTQQFFGALLRALAIWQFISVVAESPQLILFVSQIANGNNQPAVLFYVLGPILRAVIGGALFLKADSLARLIYPDP